MKHLFLISAVVTALVLLSVPGYGQDGKEVYTKKCGSCHNVDGTSKPAIEKAMKVTMKPLGSKEVQAKTDAQLKKDTVDGIGRMKGVQGMADQELDAVIKYVRSLRK
jgi:mono/diheme cytochrome c family protein